MYLVNKSHVYLPHAACVVRSVEKFPLCCASFNNISPWSYFNCLYALHKQETDVTWTSHTPCCVLKRINLGLDLYIEMYNIWSQSAGVEYCRRESVKAISDPDQYWNTLVVSCKPWSNTKLLLTQDYWHKLIIGCFSGSEMAFITWVTTDFLFTN